MRAFVLEGGVNLRAGLRVRLLVEEEDDILILVMGFDQALEELMVAPVQTPSLYSDVVLARVTARVSMSVRETIELLKALQS